MAYIIAHSKRLDETHMGKLSRHCQRKNDTEKYIVRPEMTQKNVYEGPKFINREWSARIRELVDKGMKPPRKDAARGIETLYTASPEFWDDLRKRHPEPAGFVKAASGFFKDCREFHEKWYGPTTLQYSVHFDETNPHMHVIDIPLVENGKDADGKTVWKYSSSGYLGGIEKLRAYHTALANQVGQKYGLERGEEGSRARHTGLEDWNREIVRPEEKRAMAIREAAMKEREKKLEMSRKIFLKLIDEVGKNPNSSKAQEALAWMARWSNMSGEEMIEIGRKKMVHDQMQQQGLKRPKKATRGPDMGMS